MKNIFLLILLIALAISFGCQKQSKTVKSGEKTSEKTAEKTVIGKWKAVKTYNPDSGKWEEVTEQETVIDFQEDGKYENNVPLKVKDPATYKVDNSVEPHQIILTSQHKNEPKSWIYKFQGERLIVKIPSEAKYGAAKDFSIEPNFSIIEFERQ
jgi:uncharacterized protein (TIGR03067 family)